MASPLAHLLERLRSLGVRPAGPDAAAESKPLPPLAGRNARPLGLRSVNLALQGGGAYGAFTAGVLDRFLEDGRVPIGGVSGASAGAMNAAALASGLATGGPQGARDTLARLWDRVAASASSVSVLPFAVSELGGAREALRQLAAVAGLGAAGPAALESLGRTLDAVIDFEALRTRPPFPMAIAATNVQTDEARIFSETEITREVLLASACLPQIFGTVTIDGVPYWDGGYTSNPPLIPLVVRGKAETTLVVRLIASGREAPPRSGPETAAYLSTFPFSRAYLAERRALATLRQAAQAQPLASLSDMRLRRLRDHRLLEIDGAEAIAAVGPIDALVPTRSTVARLMEAGRDAATAWLADQGLAPTDRPQSALQEDAPIASKRASMRS